MEEAEKKEYWEKDQQKLTQIYEFGFESFARNIADIKKAFMLQDRSLRCIDEGTPGGIHLAGSGILLGEREVLQVLQPLDLDGVYSHQGCGAVELYKKSKGIDLKKADELADEWAGNLATLLKIPYKGQIALSDLKRPAEFHNARVIYYDGTGRFDYSQVPDLPPGFSISRRFLARTYALKELEIAVGIALGDHGFNGFFSQFNPLLVILVGDTENPSFSVEELNMETAGLISSYSMNVRSDSLTINLR